MATSQPYTVACAGGLVTASNQIDLLKTPGVATELRNFEVSIKGGYRRINGFSRLGAGRNRRLAKERGEIPEEILSNIEQPLKFNKGGRVGLNKGGQPSYSNGEMPTAKPN